MRRATSILAGGLALAMLAAAGPAGAASIVFTVDGTQSMLTADVSATLDVTAYTSLGNAPGNASASGPLSSVPTGTITADVSGVPGGALQVDVAAGGAPITTPSPGSANGTATINLFGFIPLNLDLTVNVDSIGIDLASPLSTLADPLAPDEWGGIGMVDILLSAQVDFSATGSFGINIAQNDILIGPSVVSAIPLVSLLRNTGGGSEIELPFPGLSISLPPQPTSNFDAPGCEVSGGFFCAFNVHSVDVALTSLTLSNIQGTIVATSAETLPEPGAAALLGAALAALGLRAGRRRG